MGEYYQASLSVILNVIYNTHKITCLENYSELLMWHAVHFLRENIFFPLLKVGCNDVYRLVPRCLHWEHYGSPNYFDTPEWLAVTHWRHKNVHWHSMFTFCRLWTSKCFDTESWTGDPNTRNWSLGPLQKWKGVDPGHECALIKVMN